MDSSPPLPPSQKKVPVARLKPIITKPLNANCFEVVAKLKKALITAQSGVSAGALIFTIDKEGAWQTDVAGLMFDRETLGQIALHLLGAYFSPE